MTFTAAGGLEARPPSPLAGEGGGEGEAQGVDPRNFATIRQTITPHPDPLPQGERGPEGRVALAKVLARTALGVIWVYEGLVPKLLYVTQQEIDLVARSQVYGPTPRATLAALGVCEILGGLWLLSGKSEKTAAALSFALVAVVGPACAVLDPSILYHPFGGLSKNLALLACAAVVWLLSAKPGANLPENEWGGGAASESGSDNPALCRAEPSAILKLGGVPPGPVLPLPPGEGEQEMQPAAAMARDRGLLCLHRKEGT